MPLANTLVVLTSDHGVLPLVETLQAKGIEARRAHPRVLEAAVEQALEKKYPGVENLIADSRRDIYLDEEVMQRHQLKRQEVETTIIDALLSTGLVEAVYTHSQLLSDKPSNDPYIELFRRQRESVEDHYRIPIPEGRPGWNGGKRCPYGPTPLQWRPGPHTSHIGFYPPAGDATFYPHIGRVNAGRSIFPARWELCSYSKCW